MANKRKAIGKKLRFDVFKRDGFQCIYCGKTPPKVILEIDHIDPVSKGGKNDINNLVTACFSCNRGKRNIRLDKRPKRTAENIELLEEQESQLKEYRKLLKKISRRVNKDINEINDVFEEAYPGWGFSNTFKKVSLTTFLKLLAKEKIIDSLYMAISKFSNNSDKAIKYFCGICWNKIRENEVSP